MQENRFVLWFDEIGIGDVPSVGGKNASLGEMYQELSGKGIKVPYGFAITAYAYRHFLEKSDIRREIEETLKGLDTGTVANLRERGRRIRTAIVDAELPEELKEAIVAAYRRLCRSTARSRMWQSGAALLPRTFLLQVLQDSRRHTSTSTGRRHCSLHARGALHRYLQTGPSHTG